MLTLFDSQTKLSNEVVAELRSFIESGVGKALPWSAATIFQSKIRRNIKLAESPSFGKTIIAYDTVSNGAADYRALAREINAMGDASAAAPPAASGQAPISVAVNRAIDPSSLAAAKLGSPQDPRAVGA